VVPHREDVMLQEWDVFRDFVALHEREGGLPQIAFFDPATFARRRVQFPEADYEVSPDRNPEYEQKELRRGLPEPRDSQSCSTWTRASLGQKAVKRQPVPNYDPSRYQVERIWAPAADGVKVPVAVLHKKGAARDGKSPLLLYGYGSYGIDGRRPVQLQRVFAGRSGRQLCGSPTSAAAASWARNGTTRAA